MQPNATKKGARSKTDLLHLIMEDCVRKKKDTKREKERVREISRIAAGYTQGTGTDFL